MSLRRLVWLWLPPLAYVALLYSLSAQKQPPGAELVWDKLLHAIGYAVLGVLALRAFHGGFRPLELRATLLAFLFTVGYGMTDEFHQSFVPGRDASLLDVVADAVGFLLAVLALLLAFRTFLGRADAADRGKS